MIEGVADNWRRAIDPWIDHEGLELIEQRSLAARDRPIVFMLWGQVAQRKRPIVDRRPHIVIESPHPAARVAADRSFASSRPFSRANEALDRLGLPAIDWSLRA